VLGAKQPPPLPAIASTTEKMTRNEPALAKANDANKEWFQGPVDPSKELRKIKDDMRKNGVLPQDSSSEDERDQEETKKEGIKPGSR
jgi:hypothetical protein